MFRRNLLAAVAVTIALGGVSAIAKAQSSSDSSSGKLEIKPAVLTQSSDQDSVITPVQYRRGYRNYYRPYRSNSYRSYYYPRYNYGYYGYRYPSYGYSSYYRPYYRSYYYPRYYTGYRGFSYYGPRFYGSFYW